MWRNDSKADLGIFFYRLQRCKCKLPWLSAAFLKVLCKRKDADSEMQGSYCLVDPSLSSMTTLCVGHSIPVTSSQHVI